ncbi:hypothetical protein LCGC14_0944680 [marine sediment metagenome]|uniref:Uncharacterized protein n=1 Tax=marine sediment metagenome TaxID=412755 RepID=A0A0F9RQD9_9ZZZZ
MIDNALPLPDHELIENNKVRYSFGPYMKTKFCRRCRCYHDLDDIYYLWECCPNCGKEPFELVVGRFKVKTEKKGFSIFKKFQRKIIGFTPKYEDMEGKND